jgi:hypothetical protein
MNRLCVLLCVGLIAGTGCGVRDDGPPVIEVDRTVCAHCGMFVSEPIYAAAYRTADGEAHVFDDIACLRVSARAEPDREGLVFWFRDADREGWIPGPEAVVVRSPQLQTPMGGGLLAYRDRAAASRAAEAHQGEVVDSLATLLWGKEGGE